MLGLCLIRRAARSRAKYIHTTLHPHHPSLCSSTSCKQNQRWSLTHINKYICLLNLILMASYGLRSPPLPETQMSRPSYDTETLRAYIKKLLSTTLQNAVFPSPREKDKCKAWCKEIGERVKQKMIGTHTSPNSYGIN